MRTLRALPFAAAVALLSAPAYATHPDHEGERGFELSLQPGVGIFTSTDDRVFLQASDFTTTSSPINAFGGAGFALRASLGYRVMPLFSAGLTVGFQTLSPSGLYDARKLTNNPSDSLSNFNFGAYAPTSSRSSTERATTLGCSFEAQQNHRRFEAYFTLGVDFVSGITPAAGATPTRWTPPRGATATSVYRSGSAGSTASPPHSRSASR